MQKGSKTRPGMRAAQAAPPGVIAEAGQKPVRSKPMRGPDAQMGSAGKTAGTGMRSAGRDAISYTDTPDRDMHVKVKEDICVQMLMGGYVQSFVDMFYLTHRTVNEHAEEQAGLQVPVMEFLRDQLVTAEHCKRRGEIPDVLNAYDNLAAYCAEKNDVKTMIFFFDKCLEIARLVKDPMCEMRVLNKIGSGYHALKDLARAQEFHEKHVAIAQVIYEHEDDAALRGDAFMQLGKVYWDIAGLHEGKHQYEEAIEFFKKYLDCASKADAQEAIGDAQLKIGMCYNKLTQPSNALPFLEAYLMSCQTGGLAEGEGKACAELATAHETLGNKQVSIEFLNHYASIATTSDNLANQADACRRLGHIYTASQDFQRAREMHEKNYELSPAVAASTKDTTAINCSRVNLGAARANDRLAMFLSLIKDDFRGLLEWKNSRTLPATD